MSVKLEERFREAEPTHLNFLFKVESFSLFSENTIVKYESSEFETGGYKWKLVFYPGGNKNEDGGEGHISLYLMLVDTTSLPAFWELNVVFKLFLFDQIRDRYLIRGDMDGKTKRFHEMKKMSGFVQFLSLSKLNDPKNGYLLDDTCLFGAEVFVSKPRRIIECLSMVKEVTTVKYTWKIENFTNIKEEFLYSEKFKAGDHNWDLLIYPQGNSGGKNNSVSLYLNFPDCKKDTGLKAYASFKLQIKDQINGKHIGNSYVNIWFHHALQNWGTSKFIRLSEMTNDKGKGWSKLIGLSEMTKDKGKGYLVNDTCIVEAEVKVLGVVSKRT